MSLKPIIAGGFYQSGGGGVPSGAAGGDLAGTYPNPTLAVARATLGANTFTGAQTISVAGAASVPAMLFSGAIFTGGTGTTNFPHFFIQPAGATAATTWSTAGTLIGVNAATGFTGNGIDLRIAGTSFFTVSNIGVIASNGNGSGLNLIDSNDGGSGFLISRQAAGIWGISRGDGAGATQCLQWATNAQNLSALGNLSVGTTHATRDTIFSRLAATVIGVTGLGAAAPQALSGPGAVNITTLTTLLTSTGALEALTLADGVAGQFKSIIHDVDGGSSVLTPATKTGYTTITFTVAGDACLLQFVTTRGWMILSLRGAVAA